MKRILHIVLGLVLPFVAIQAQTPVSLTSIATAYTQNFDSLSNTGTTGTIFPRGFYILEVGTNANTSYGVDSGSANSGNTYSYGSTKTSTDRAFGALSSVSVLPTLFGSFVNKTTSNITSFDFDFFGEQYRTGGRGATTLTSDTLKFGYRIGAGTTFTSNNNLNVYSPVISTAAGSALNGNLTSNRVRITYTLTGINVKPGDTFIIRFSDPNIFGSDDGLAIDDFTLTPRTSIASPQVAFLLKSDTIIENLGNRTVFVDIATPNGSTTSVNVFVDPSSTATLGTDYTLSANTLTFLGNSSAQTSFTINVIDDNIFEGDERIVLRLRNQTNNATRGDSLFTFTIRDNETPANPILSFGLTRDSILENAGSRMVFVTIASPNTNATNVSLVLNPSGSATLGTDYTISTTSLTFAAGSTTSQSFSINVIDDAVLEGRETIIIRLRNQTNNATRGDSILTFTIIDNEVPPVAKPSFRKIRDVSADIVATVRPVLQDSFVRLKGIVSTGNFRTGGLQIFFYDSTGNTSLFAAAKNFGYTPVLGDSVQVVGKVAFLNGVTQITFSRAGIDTVFRINSGNTVKSPVLVTRLNEGLEANLVRVNNVRALNPSQWTPGVGSGFNVQVQPMGTQGTIDLQIDNDVDLFNMPIPTTGFFDVIGIVSQFDATAPFSGGYLVMPRSRQDITVRTNPPAARVPEYPIRTLRTNATDGRADSIGKRVFVRGIVHSGNFSSNGLQFAIKDANSSITIFASSKINGYTPVRGDSVLIRGTVSQFNGLTLITGDSIATLGSGTQLPSRDVSNLDESTESDLVTLRNLAIVEPSQWTKTGNPNGFNVQVTDGANTFTLRIDTDVADLYNSTAPTGRFDATGIGSQFDNASPFTEGYQLMPRDADDIKFITGVRESSSVNALHVGMYPNPSLNTVTLTGLPSLGLSQISIISTAGQVMQTINITNAPSTTLNVSALSNGVYLVRIQSEGALSTLMLIKN